MMPEQCLAIDDSSEDYMNSQYDGSDIMVSEDKENLVMDNNTDKSSIIKQIFNYNSQTDANTYQKDTKNKQLSNKNFKLQNESDLLFSQFQTPYNNKQSEFGNPICSPHSDERGSLAAIIKQKEQAKNRLIYNLLSQENSAKEEKNQRRIEQ